MREKASKLFFVLSKSIMTPLFGFLISILGIRFFGKTDWGVFLDVMLSVWLVVFILNWGNKDYLIRKYADNPSKINAFFYINFFSRTAFLPLSLLLFFFYPTSIVFCAVLLILMMHVYMSLNSIIIYKQLFKKQLLAEILGFVLIILGFRSFHTFSLIEILLIFSFSFFLKILFVCMGIKMPFKKEYVKINFRDLKLSLPFFLLAFSGWLTSNLDLYLVNTYLTKSELSSYQIFIKAFILLQTLAYLLTVPFSKHIYRLQNKSIASLQKKMYLVALPLVIFVSLCIWVVLEKIVVLGLPIEYYILGGFMALPSFFFTMDVLKLLKEHQEKKVVIINFISVTANGLLVYLIIQKYGLLGVLISVMSIQWLLLILYKLKFVKNTNT